MERYPKSSSTSPAFIISCPRSGSTLTRYIVDTHPDFCSPPELNLGRLCEVLYSTIYYTKGGVPGAADENGTNPVVLAEVRRITSGLMESYAAGKKKRRWCEKSPQNIGSLRILSNVYPDAKYVCLYRNCMDFVYSVLESCKLGYWNSLLEYVRRSPGNLVNAMAEAWADKTEALLKFEREHPANTFRITYEALVSNTAETLKPMFEFLEAEWDESLIDSALSTKHEQGYADLKAAFATRIHTKSIGKGSLLRRIHLGDKTLEKVNKLLEELGYPIIGPDWGTVPSPYLRSDAREEEALSEVDKIFDEYFPRLLKERESDWQHINAIFKMIVIGDDGGQWIIDLTGEEPRIRAGNGDADCTITVSHDDLIDMVNGKLNAGEVVNQGHVNIAGDLELARAIGSILLKL